VPAVFERVAGMLGLVVTVGLAASLLDEAGLPRHGRLRTDLRHLRAQSARLEAENAALQREIEGLRRHPAVIEAAVREELGWVRPGEVVVRSFETARR